MFSRADWTLFRSLNTLGQKAGVPVDRIPRLVAKELADNALDDGAGCSVGMLGEENGFWVEDDGSGIDGDDEFIASLFSIRRPLASMKMLRRPTRGALGNGLRVVAGAVMATRGRLVVSTGGRSLELVPREADGTTDALRIGDWPHDGTRIEVRFGPAIRVDIGALKWARSAIGMAAGGSYYQGKSSPYWYDSEAFFELLMAAGRRTVRDVVAELHGCAEPKAGRIAAEFKGRLARDLSRAEADRVLRSALGHATAVSARKLGEVGRSHFDGSGYAAWRDTLSLGSPQSTIQAQLPFVIEAWASPSQGKDSAALFVNRTPTTGSFQAYRGNKRDLGFTGCGIEEYWEVATGRRPFDFVVNVITPYMPITTDGKEPDITRLAAPIQEVVSRAIRGAKRKTPAARGEVPYKRQVIIDNIAEGSAKAGGGHRFGRRQLFYVIRPRFMEVIGEEPKWSYFTQVITDYENAIDSDIPGMYRDPRGIIYHPHLGQEIPLGTLYVERYERPAWLFNKVLYCEKEGFFSTLRAVDWPERNDCALMTSKGFSTRAARDFIDMLAETDEECNFFCIHDADAAGTMIYQTLQQATKARDARKVHIHNLGLEPAEARAMGLQVERFQRENDNELSVAEYVPADDRAWLQSHRVELNAMTTPQFLEWLDRKFEPFRGKVIPPPEVMTERLEADIRSGLEDRVKRAILRRHDIDGLVEREYARRADAIKAALASTDARVRASLARDNRQPWTAPVGRIARQAIARRSGGRRS
jgi:hypothetical protein